MADEHQLAVLRQGSDAWNAWRADHRDVLPNLKGANLETKLLRGANFVGVNLAGANFVGVNLAGANLSSTILSGANLSSANLAEANFEGAFLQGANLSGANLRGANLAGANLAGVFLRRANLRKNLRGETLREAYLQGADLQGAFLNEANLTGANLIGANFETADLEEANLQGADFRGANLLGVNLAGANLAGAMLFQANLLGANLEGANLEGVPKKGILHIPLRNQVLARDLGHLLAGLADLYSVTQDIEDIPREELVFKRISVGTPNLVELMGMLPPITSIAAALFAVLKIPEDLGEAAAARKAWIEGSLLKKPVAETSQLTNQHQERIASSFNSLARSRVVVSVSVAPTVWIEGSEAPERKEVVPQQRPTTE